MNLINNVTSDPNQKRSIVLDDGSFFTFTMLFRPMQLGWFITQLTYENFTLNECRISNSPNFLYQYQNLIPFGLACYSTANREPSLIEDFSSLASKLYVLDTSEVAEYTEFVRNGA